MTTKILKDRDTSELETLLINIDGSLNVVPAAAYEPFDQDLISLFCVKFGYYCLPTTELIDFLDKRINERKAIEIGAGNGSVGRALGITMTDNFQQEMLKYKQLYEMIQQATVPYGPDVLAMDAITAVKRLKPKVVLGCWVTHEYDPRYHERGGNEIGIKEEWILKNCSEYIFVGNISTHHLKPICDLPHETIKADWLVSPAFERSTNVIKIWSK